MRVNCGSGKKNKKGYINIDIQEGADVIGDFRKMHYEDLEEVRSHHLLEHFSREESIEILKLWYSWLKRGGQLVIETPDFEGICLNFYKDKYWLTRHAYGSQEANWAFHKDGWYEDKFREILPKIGFEIRDVQHNTTRKILPNIQITAIKI